MFCNRSFYFDGLVLFSPSRIDFDDFIFFLIFAFKRISMKSLLFIIRSVNDRNQMVNRNHAY